MLGTKLLTVAIDFHSMEKILWKSMGTTRCFGELGIFGLKMGTVTVNVYYKTYLSVSFPEPLLNLRLQCDPLSQPLLRQADPQRSARASAARLSQTQRQVRVLRERVHRRGP